MGKPLSNSKCSESDSKIYGWLFINMSIALYSLKRTLKYKTLFKVHHRPWIWVLWSLLYRIGNSTQSWRW